jgi:redox-sensitive bicupin YhaK (pirin superfamily)
MKRRGFIAALIGLVALPFGYFLRSKSMGAKKVKLRRKAREKHWVGDGFHVSSLFHASEESIVDYLSPFVLLDYAAPEYFSATDKKRGVGEHPHRGFETVTFCHSGGVTHRDSGGGGGTIAAGDVQWMTAGKGVVHEEFHSEEFAKSGGEMEMLQLWVNLPKKDKMREPRYQDIRDKDFPRIQANAAVTLKLMAGELLGEKSPALIHTPMTIFDVDFNDDSEVSIPLKAGTNTIVIGMRDGVSIDGSALTQKEMVLYEREGEELILKGSKGGKCFVLNGEPLNEPVVAYGPFVMNTAEEIRQAFSDYQQGKMGHL